MLVYMPVGEQEWVWAAESLCVGQVCLSPSLSLYTVYIYIYLPPSLSPSLSLSLSPSLSLYLSAGPIGLVCLLTAKACGAASVIITGVCLCVCVRTCVDL